MNEKFFCSIIFCLLNQQGEYIIRSTVSHISKQYQFRNKKNIIKKIHWIIVWSLFVFFFCQSNT